MIDNRVRRMCNAEGAQEITVPPEERGTMQFPIARVATRATSITTRHNDVYLPRSDPMRIPRPPEHHSLVQFMVRVIPYNSDAYKYLRHNRRPPDKSSGTQLTMTANRKPSLGYESCPKVVPYDRRTFITARVS